MLHIKKFIKPIWSVPALGVLNHTEKIGRLGIRFVWIYFRLSLHTLLHMHGDTLCAFKNSMRALISANRTADYG